MNALFNRLLSDRCRVDGSRPLITYYAEPGGIRTELSATSFANWVDKTAGLLTDDIGLAPGDGIKLDLLHTAPGHWVTLAWVAATWRVGCPVIATAGPSSEAMVEVVGPERAQDDPGSVDRVACSLHPFGLGFREPLPAGVIDYGVEVRAHPDHFTGPWPTADARAWVDGVTSRTQQDVVGAAATAPAGRIMIDPAESTDPWSTVVDCLITPVVTSGSVVVTVGADAARRAQIAAAEQTQ